MLTVLMNLVTRNIYTVILWNISLGVLSIVFCRIFSEVFSDD